MKLHSFLYLLLSLFFSLPAFSQNCTCAKGDSLRPLVGKYFNSGKLDSAAFILEKLNIPAQSPCYTIYLDGMAQVSMGKKLFGEAAVFLSKEEKVLADMACNTYFIRFLNTKAKYYQQIGERDSVSWASLRVIALAKEEKNWVAAARASINLASIFSQEKQEEKAYFYNKEALSYARQGKDTMILIYALNGLAQSFLDKQRSLTNRSYLDSSYLLTKEGLELARNRPSALIELPNSYNKLSNYYLTIEDYAKTILYADSAIRVSPKGVYDFFRHQLNAYLNKSAVFYQQKQYPKAIEMADSAYVYARKFNLQLGISPLETIYKSAKALGQYEKAVWAHERMTTIQDSIFSLEKTAKINELEKKYNQAKNEKTIKELAQQSQIYALLALVALLLLIAIAFGLRQQSLKNKQKIMETEQRLNRVRINPHFFFNALTALQSVILNENDKRKLILNFSSFSKLMRKTLESSYTEFISIDKELEFLSHYFEIQLLRKEAFFSYKYIISDDIEAEEVAIPAMLIQPFVENSIEHGFRNYNSGGEIVISFRKEKEYLYVLITDNGAGLDSNAEKKEQDHISRATQITQDRLFLINKLMKKDTHFQVLPNSPQGTKVEIVLPFLYCDEITSG